MQTSPETDELPSHSHPSAWGDWKDGLVRELNGSATPKEAPAYYPQYPGFEALMRTPIVPIEEAMRFALPDELNRLAAVRDKPRCIASALKGSRA